MKKTTIVPFLAAVMSLVVACATAPPASQPLPVPPPPPPATVSMTAAQLLDKVVEAFGGAAAVDSVDKIEIQGNSRRTLVNGQEWSMLVTSYLDFPDRYRQEVIIPQARIVTVVNHEGAFLFTEAAGTIALPPAERAAILSGLQRNPLAILQRRANVLATLEPEETVDGKRVAIVRVEETAGTTRLAIDPATGDIVQIRYASAGGGEEKTQEMIVAYGNYRKVGNVRFPFHSEGHLGGKHAFTTDLDGMTINPKLAESLFDTPQAPPPAAPATQPGAAAPPASPQMRPERPSPPPVPRKPPSE